MFTNIFREGTILIDLIILGFVSNLTPGSTEYHDASILSRQDTVRIFTAAMMLTELREHRVHEQRHSNHHRHRRHISPLDGQFHLKGICPTYLTYPWSAITFFTPLLHEHAWLALTKALVNFVRLPLKLVWIANYVIRSIMFYWVVDI